MLSPPQVTITVCPFHLRPTTERVYMTHFRQVNLAPLHPHPRYLPFPRTSIQSGGRRKDAGVWLWISHGPQLIQRWDTRAGWPGSLRSHHTPLGEGLVSPKQLSRRTQQPLASGWGTFGAKFEVQQAEENRQLKALSSQRQVPEVSCSFCSAST